MRPRLGAENSSPWRHLLTRWRLSLVPYQTTLAWIKLTFSWLRAAHETKGLWSGINVYTGEITDMMKEGVLEPVKVKEHAIGSAVEVASMILRIDDVIAAAKPPPMPKGQGPPPD